MKLSSLEKIIENVIEECGYASKNAFKNIEDFNRFNEIKNVFKYILKDFKLYAPVMHRDNLRIVPIKNNTYEGAIIIDENLNMQVEIGKYLSIVFSPIEGLKCFVIEYGKDTGIIFSDINVNLSNINDNTVYLNYYDQEACEATKKMPPVIEEKSFRKLGIEPDETFEIQFSENFIDDYQKAALDFLNNKSNAR